MAYEIEKIPQYKKGDMIVLTKFKPEWGFYDEHGCPKLNTPYIVEKYVSEYSINYDSNTTIAPVVIVGISPNNEGEQYGSFSGWWIPCEIITHAKSMDELTKIIMDKVKAAKGA